MYKYETHLHSSPVSKCGSYSVRENMEFYKEIGYDGIFLTNHFIDANIGCDRTLPYKEQIEFFFTDIEEGEKLASEVGIKFFWGIETSYLGTDFLIYGLSKKWYLEHPEIMDMPRKDLLTMMANDGALIVQAHPFREASYIDHIRLFPYHVHAVEIDNCGNKPFQNDMARLYTDTYRLHHFISAVGIKKENFIKAVARNFVAKLLKHRDKCHRADAYEAVKPLSIRYLVSTRNVSKPHRCREETNVGNISSYFGNFIALQ